MKTNLTSHHLGKGNTFSFSSRHTSDKLIPNSGFPGMVNAQRSQDVISHMLNKAVFLFQVLWPLPRDFVSQSKLQRLVDGQRGEVNIIYQVL